MNIIVTGSEGFVGKLLVKRLEELGHEVVGIDLPMDIRDKSYLNREAVEGTDICIHLASISRDKDCQKDMYECFDHNVMGTLNVLRLAQMCKVKQFIFASSEWVYGESNVDQNEGVIINTMTLGEYALSKHVSEVNLLQNFIKTNLPITVLRFGITYGPREKNWTVVESLFDSVRNEKPITIGSHKTGRYYTHVEDIVSGIISSFGLTGYHIFNLCANEFVNLGSIIYKASIILGKKPNVTELNPDSPSIRKMSNMKMRMILKWKPQYGIQKGLETLL